MDQVHIDTGYQHLKYDYCISRTIYFARNDSVASLIR